MLNRMIVLLSLLFVSTALFAQKGVTVTVAGQNYAAISSEGMARGFETRNEADIYYSSPLYEYMPTTGSAQTPVMDGGNQVYVNRMVRHNQTGNSYSRNATGSWVFKSYNPNQKVSTLFAVAHSNIDDNGNPSNTTIMDWARAAGFLISANSNAVSVESSATAKGCSQYGGRNNDSAEKGKWRLPTQRELMLMWILRGYLQSTSATTGFVSFTANYHWSATESGATSSWSVGFGDGYTGSFTKTTTFCVRCVRDITP